MKTEEETKKIGSNVKAYLADELFKKGDYDYLTGFYLENAKKSLSTADALMQLSENGELKKKFSLVESFETYLWVCAISYYSMFYAVNALFSKNGIKVGDRIAHQITCDLFYYYFVKNNRIAKELFKIYEEAKEQADELVGIKYQAQALQLSKNLEFEKNKRSKFQYNMTASIKRSYAKTSLERAKEFIDKIELLIK